MPLVAYDFVKYFLVATGGLGFVICMFAMGLIIYRKEEETVGMENSPEAESSPEVESSPEADETTPLIAN